MAHVCTICRHQKRAEIELALPLRSERSIAEQFGVSNSAVHRHKAKCAVALVQRATDAREDLLATDLLDHLHDLLKSALDGVTAARDTNDLTARARLIKESRETIIAIGKTKGLWTERGGSTVDARSMTVHNHFDNLPPVLNEALSDPERAAKLIPILMDSEQLTRIIAAVTTRDSWSECGPNDNETTEKVDGSSSFRALPTGTEPVSSLQSPSKLGALNQ